MPVETDAEIRDILGYKTVAVVGCSSTPGKDAHEIPKYHQRQGYEIKRGRIPRPNGRLPGDL